MKFAARMIAIMAFAFLLAPALCADDTAKPAARAKKVEAVNPRVAPSAVAKAVPAATPAASLLATAVPQSSAGASSGAESNTPKVELFLGYSYVRAMPQSLKNRIAWMHGGNGSIAFNLNSYLGLVADFAGYRSNELRLTGAGIPPTVVLDADGTAFTFLFGPRLSYRKHERVTPFAQVLFGVAHAGEVSIPGCAGLGCIPIISENVFAMTAGGGFDVKVHRNIAFRIIQAEYLMTRFRDPSPGAGQTGTRSNLRLSTGIVFRFGANPPPPPPANRAPVAACSVDKEMVYVGSADIAVVRAQASDPDNDSLSYTWTTTGGAVEGTGPEVRWNSSGTTAGTYAVKVRVSDSRGGTADCSADIRVEARPNRVPTLTCSAERSPVRPGERVRLSAEGSDADGDSLTYTWRASSGQIIGSGQSVQFDTSSLSAGAYPVTVRVEDGRGGAADCSASVSVEVPPPPPQASKINECFFRASSARVDNVCKRILDDVVIRLQNDAKAKVVIVGYADPKEPRPDRLAGQRTDAVKKYLAEKGIADSRVDVRAASGQAGADKQNRRIDIVWAPEGATY